MRSIDAETLEGWCFNDATFSGLSWVGNSLHLFLELGAGDGDVGELICPWTSGLQLDLHWGESERSNASGTLLSVEGTARREDDGRWCIQIDFGSSGTLSFSCESVFVKPVAAA